MKIEHCQKKSIGKNIIEVQFFLMLIEKIFDKNKIVSLSSSENKRKQITQEEEEKEEGLD